LYTTHTFQAGTTAILNWVLELFSIINPVLILILVNCIIFIQWIIEDRFSSGIIWFNEFVCRRRRVPVLHAVKVAIVDRRDLHWGHNMVHWKGQNRDWGGVPQSMVLKEALAYNYV
jgi:hypothetical protein